MNYFAHGIRFLDRPLFLAGTAIPDWLSVADRKVRMRSKRVAPFVDHADADVAEIARGVAQHLDDDGWFHQTRAFFEVTDAVSQNFRDMLGPDDGFRPGFLGHITTELLLDAALIDRQPLLIDRYYEVIAELDVRQVQDVVNLMGTSQTDRLAGFIDVFRQVQFLRDYTDSSRLLFRLNQVMQRVRLPQLPENTVEVLAKSAVIVRDNVDELLPPTLFK